MRRSSVEVLKFAERHSRTADQFDGTIDWIAAVEPVDRSWTRRDGTDRTPVIPSHEVSGTVVQTGPGVTETAIRYTA
ncbi:hypothetical protein GCM10027262_50690 [Nocardia tengchongensis]